jgi:hypothetical protein
MNTVLIPERRSYSDYFRDNNFYTRILSNGTTEHYSKEFYNSNFTRKYDGDDIRKEILLYLLDDLLL